MKGGARLAEVLGTEVMGNAEEITLNMVCFSSLPSTRTHAHVLHRQTWRYRFRLTRVNIMHTLTRRSGSGCSSRVTAMLRTTTTLTSGGRVRVHKYGTMYAVP
jgi:hypothetical protein